MSHQTEPSPVAVSRRGWTSLLSLGIAALACPCHVPLALILFAGTTLGAWLSQHRGVATLVMLGMFVVSLLYGLRGFNRQHLATEATHSAASSIPTRDQEAPRVSGVKR
jgi:mercuric ion transport protein